MTGTEGLLKPAQQRPCLVPLVRQLTCCRCALWLQRPQERSICKIIFLRRLVTLTRALIGTLLEKLIGKRSRLLLCRDRARLLRVGYGISER